MEIALMVSYEGLNFVDLNVNLISSPGDEFLFMVHKMSPFFKEKSSFQTWMAYDGRNKIHNITKIQLRSYGVKSRDNNLSL